jgi:hypothetical protein
MRIIAAAALVILPLTATAAQPVPGEPARRGNAGPSAKPRSDERLPRPPGLCADRAAGRPRRAPERHPARPAAARPGLLRGRPHGRRMPGSHADRRGAAAPARFDALGHALTPFGLSLSKPSPCFLQNGKEGPLRRRLRRRSGQASTMVRCGMRRWAVPALPSPVRGTGRPAHPRTSAAMPGGHGDLTIRANGCR